jgi:hypothetical protein
MRSTYGKVGIALASLCLFSLATTAHAGDFLIDTTGGTDLRPFLSDLNDGYAVRSTGFSYDFFDVTRSGINVTTNGFLHVRKTDPVETTANVSPANATLPTSGSIHRIAGAWDDLILSRPEDAIIENKGTNFYSVTYLVHKNQTGGGEAQFQIALFGGDVTIGPNSFKKNDIAFSYRKMVGIPVGGDATVGMDAGNGSFSAPSAYPNGIVDDYSKLVSFTSSNPGAETGFYKFSQDAGGNYVPSLVISGPVASAPEPGTLGLIALGATVLGAIRLRRRS